MKVANEYSKSFDLDKQTTFIVDEITNICNTIGPRKSGSPEELKAQQHMEEVIKPISTNTKIEEFTLHRQGFMGFIPFTVCCAVASTFVNYFYSSILAFILCITAFIPLIFEFLMYKEFNDFLFPKQTSHNMIASIKPKGEVKKRFIMIGHSDSQFEWTINYLISKISKNGGLIAKLIVEIPAVVGLVIQTFVSLICIVSYAVTKPFVFNMAANSIPVVHWLYLTFFIVSCVFIPMQISFIFFQSHTKAVPGASDNLTGCYTGLTVAKALNDAGVQFENTEIVIICSGSEEAGLRGSKAYVKAHEKELKEIPTAVIALDTFRDLEDMAIYDRDLSGTVQHDYGVKHLLKQAALNCGYDLPFESIYIGGSDGASFTQKGIPATSFSSMNPDPPPYYHTRLDTPENLRPEAIKAGLEIMIETICLYDKEGCPKEN